MTHRKLDPRHSAKRDFLRVVGPLVFGLGLVFTIIGLVSFFSAFGNFGGPPKYFWCAFIGIPLMGLGGALCKFAFLGAVGRYVAGETAPVARDTFNYVADGTKEGIRDVAGAIGQGLSAGMAGTAGGERRVVLRCHKCNHSNDADARFCDQCGAPLEKTRHCPNCGELNDPDARFCDNCGRPMSS